MTKKLYDDAPYEKEFHAKIVEIKEEDKDKLVALNQTLFFPNEGGQNPDWGKLAGYEVKDVRIKEGIIWHRISDECSLEVGDEVHGEIDFWHRYDLMQQHSGEHILSGVIYKKYGYTNVGFHLTEDIVTVDTSGPLTQEQILELEMTVNNIIRENVKITTGYPCKEELSKLEYRSKKELNEEIRIVQIGEYDICACCAPHVASTGEVMSLQIVNWENYKGGVRLEIMCGNRAIKESIKQRLMLKQLSKELSAKQNSIVDSVKRLKEDNGKLKQEMANALNELISMKAKAVEAKEHIVVFEKNLDGTAHRNYANLLMEKASTVAAVLVTSSEEGEYRYIVGSNTLDMKKIQTELKEKFEAKGGGKAPMIQGTLTGKKEEITKYFLSL